MPQSALLLFNIAKKHNFGNLLRTANGLGVSEVAIVGRRAFRVYGAFGTDSATHITHAFTVEEAAAALRARGFQLCGVEITDGARPVQEQPFRGDTAFLLGNEGVGLRPRELALCDHTVYVPQYGVGHSLNVNVACGIVLHHFAVWAGTPENRRLGQGFAPRDQTSAR
jgi:tRNA G18 (ribose-2'-O)-methylase SpoU